MPSGPVFFEKKEEWSKYKDLILDYYLKPYLAKVATITDSVSRSHRPVAVVDCFAGPGMFGDGERGSPLIIAEHLSRLHDNGVQLVGMFIESEPTLFAHLETNLSAFQFPVQLRQGDFRSFVSEITQLADTHTVFLYVDPFTPGQLNLGDLTTVYSKIKSGQSVETLVNFMSTAFVRRAQGLRPKASDGTTLDTQHREVLACNDIAGGDYWQQAAYDSKLSQRDRIDAIALGYKGRLEEWFKYVLPYPVRARYGDEQPKYHLIFGSRHPDAIDLMNNAMVKARRKFVGAFSVEGMLFPNQPKKEVVDPAEIEAVILETASRVGRTTWRLLRVQAILSKPCMYTDTEYNTAIKRAISNGKLRSTATGSKKENDAHVWPTNG